MSVYDKRRIMNFSAKDEERLIKVVSRQPAIYDTSHADYRDSLVKDNVWKAIARELNKTDDDCKKKWKFIRDGYHRFKKNHKVGTGSAPKHAKAKRHQLLSFLDYPEVVDRTTSPTSPAPETYEEISIVNLCAIKQEGQKDEGATDSDSNDADEAEETQEVPMATDPMLEVEMRTDPMLNQWKKSQIFIQSEVRNKEDDIDLFTRYIGEVLRNLPPVERAQAKKHLHSVISEYEIMAAKRQNN